MIDYQHLKKKHFLDWNEQWEQLNMLGKQGIPFAFISDFLGKKVHVWELDQIDPQVHFSFPNFNTSKIPHNVYSQNELFLMKSRQSEKQYTQMYDKVLDEIQKGNTYLINLCAQSEINVLKSLTDIFTSADAPYKILWEDKFTFFSPESFIVISDDKISTFPMKGTSRSLTDKSKQELLNSEKEIAEHYTVVDLLRNDLGQISHEVAVAKFRYLEEIKTSLYGFFQASSEITGKLDSDWKEHIGDILFLLSPAGSISGAPKKKTVEIIKDVELSDRNYYTGISGIFDGNNFESAVNIRYIEFINHSYYFKSGGGLTASSIKEQEYDELLRKVQIPVL